ncbi:MAG: hypothetical protein IPN87_19015 [Saprospiraceae bacterium]|nr:hypothetical protein [Candidatus Brachybacter algidus]
MSETNPKNKRKYKLYLRVPVEPEEGKISGSKLKMRPEYFEYLKKLGLGYEPTSIMDNQKVNELAKINGDLGRLGGF